MTESHFVLFVAKNLSGLRLVADPSRQEMSGLEPGLLRNPLRMAVHAGDGVDVVLALK